MRDIASILSILLLCSFRFPGNELSITGHLKSKSKNSTKNICILIKRGGIIQKTTFTDEKGNFLFEFILGDDIYDIPFSFYYITSKKDTVLLKKPVKFKNQIVEATFYIP